MSYEESQNRVIGVVLWLFYWMSLLAAPLLFSLLSVPGSAWTVIIGHPLVAVALIGHRHHAAWARHLLFIAVTAIACLLVPAAYIGREFNLAFFIIPMLALVLAGSAWVLVTSAAAYAVLLLRSGFSPIYTEPIVLIVVTMIVGGMAAARHLLDGAVRRAERQTELIEEQSRLLALERATLAQRVEERTHDLMTANEALVRASSAKNEFLAVVSHELRTPLNIILGSGDLLEEGVYGSLSEQQRRAVDRIGVSGRHLLRLIDDLLDVATLERGAFALTRTPIDATAVCDSLAELVRPAARKRGLSFACVVVPGIPPFCGDEQRLRQILLNLLTNAVKFTPPGGAVDLIVAPDPEPGWVRFTVTDTGIGIAADEQPRIFTPFVQLNSGLNRSHEGAGLGLALVAELARLHGGTLEVESATGQGSSFVVRLPCEPCPPEPASPRQ